jgi:DNA polymerase III subunit epsilon
MSRPTRALRRLFLALRRPRFPGEEELVSLDLETTSLDPKSAVILSIAAVPIRGRRIVLSESFTRTVRGEGPVDLEAVKYHRLRPVDVAQGVPAAEAVKDLVSWLGDRPLIGYCTGFDVAIVDRSLRECGSDGLDVERFDLRDLYRMRAMRRDPDAAVPGNLDAMLAGLAVPVTGRHTALGDATAVAMAYLSLRYGSG